MVYKIKKKYVIDEELRKTSSERKYIQLAV